MTVKVSVNFREFIKENWNNWIFLWNFIFPLKSIWISVHVHEFQFKSGYVFDCFYRQELCIELFSNDELDQLLLYPTSMQPHSGYNNFAKVDSGFTIEFSNL